MADRVIERTETEAPRDTVVVHEDRDRGSNNGVVIAVVVLIVLLLLLFFGSRLFGGGGGSSTTPNVNVQAPTSSQ